MLGTRELPVVGALQTRTENLVLAEVTREGDEVVLVQRACGVSFASVAGVQVSMPDGAVERLPPVRLRLPAGARPRLSATWESGWDARDVDGDGHPGATVTVSAPLCGGRLYTQSHSRNQARSVAARGAVEGELMIEVAQKVLGAEGACLGAAASDTKEQLAGTFAYREVPVEATCSSLRVAWPVRAREPTPR